MDDYDEEFVVSDDDVDDQHCSFSSIQVITMSSLMAAEKEILERVMDLFLVKEYQARALLIRHQWSFDRLMEVYAEEGPEKILADSGVFIAHENNVVISSTHDIEDSLTCNVCFDDISPNEANTMDCGHFFCTACWTEYFKVRIEEGESKEITCMAEKCNVVCGEEMVRKLVKAKHPKLADRFDRHVLASYVEDNKAMQWCPSVPHCGNAIRVDGVAACEVVEVECSCGHQFCFNCLSEPHSPCTCAMWSRWSSQFESETENLGWIKDNTKPCPRCYTRILKTSGCNVVKCKCGQKFCWFCGKALKFQRHSIGDQIAGHKCIRYDGKEATKTAMKSIDKKRNEKDHTSPETIEYHRFIHYSERYQEHKESLKLEADLTAKIKQNIAAAEGGSASANDFSWLINGLQMLFRCRRALSYTYPFAFYLFGSMLEGKVLKSIMLRKKNLFEDLQEQLQFYVERLSMAVELPVHELNEESIMETRMEVITLTTLTNNICEKLYECIENELLSLPTPKPYYIAPYKCALPRAS